MYRQCPFDGLGVFAYNLYYTFIHLQFYFAYNNINEYSLQSILLIANSDVSWHILVLDSSILLTSNMSWREYKISNIYYRQS
jgi:hypothetical protein